MLSTIEDQRTALETPVDPAMVKTSQFVKGPFTSGEYIRWKLNDVFGPDNWQHMIVDGPKLIDVNEHNAYVQVTVRLIARFVNGEAVTHDDVGVWPLVASKEKTTGREKDLTEEAPERYETVLKAAITDGVKACAEYLGICFRPLSDDNLINHLRKPIRQAQKALAAPTAPVSQAETQPPASHIPPAAPAPAAPSVRGDLRVAPTAPTAPSASTAPIDATRYYTESNGKRWNLPREWAVKIAKFAGVELAAKGADFWAAYRMLPYFAEGKAGGQDFDTLAAILKESNLDISTAAYNMRKNLPQF